MDTALPTVPDLIVHDGAAFASSRDVARVFGREHDNVLKSARKIISEAPEAAVNFNGCEYRGENGKLSPYFELTRDGFTLLAMGFTGAKALQFKLAYIAKFNAMEAELRARSDADVFALPPADGLTRDQLREDLRSAFRHFSPQIIEAVVEALLQEVRQRSSSLSPQKISFLLGTALDGEMPRLLSGVKSVLRNKENWRAAGLLPTPLPTDDTTFITATEICWSVVPDDQMHPKLPTIVGAAVVQHARDHLWPQGSTPRRSRSHRPMPTYPLSRVKEWLAAGAGDFIRGENARLRRAAAPTSQSVLQFPGEARA